MLVGLILYGDRVGRVKPFANRRIVALNKFTFGEEVAGERGSRRTFDHVLETRPGNDFVMDIDAVFDEAANDPCFVARSFHRPR